MEFIKHFTKIGSGHRVLNGSMTIKDGKMYIRLPNNVQVVEKGYIEGGIGIVVKPCKPISSLYRQVMSKIDPDYVPVELCASHYTFRILGDKISDTEYVFMYDKAECLTHK